LLKALIGVILSADFTGYLLLMILPKRATTIVVIMIEGVGVKCISPPPKIIFAISFVIAILKELKIAIQMKASTIPAREESEVRIIASE
jgi:hypothetical protein